MKKNTFFVAFFLTTFFVFGAFSKSKPDPIPLIGFYGFEYGLSYSKVMELMSERGYEPKESEENERLFYENVPFDNCPFDREQDADLTFIFKDGQFEEGTAYFPMNLKGDDERKLVGPVLKIIGWYDDMYGFDDRKYERDVYKEEKYVLYTCTGKLHDGRPFIMKIYDFKDGRPRMSSITSCRLHEKK